MAQTWTEVDVGGRMVRITSPEKRWFPQRDLRKIDVVEYFLEAADPLLAAVRERPTVLERFPDGVGGEHFFQKRVGRAPGWVTTVAVTFPAGGTAEELCPREPAHLLWAVNLGALTFHPWAVRHTDLLRPDELRVDLDPAPGVGFSTVRRVAQSVRDVLADAGLEGFPKTSGGRGIHVHVRIQPRWGYLPVRRCALALAREVERRLPDVATAAWWKEERGPRVFLDFNQNLPDRTIAAAYSVRPTAEARVACPVTWDELAEDLEPGDFTVESVPDRLSSFGDPMTTVDERAYSLETLLEWVERDERAGLGEAPFPPQFPKVPGEPPRVPPSRARRDQPRGG